MSKNRAGDRIVSLNFLLIAILLIALTGCSGKNRSAAVSGDKALQTQTALVEKGDEAFRNKEYEAAVTLYDKAIGSGYAKDQGETKKGRVYMAVGQWSSALERFDEAMQAAPDNTEAPLLAGYCAFQAKDSAKAESLLKNLIAAHPENVPARDLLGVVYNRTGKPQLAVQEFQAVVSAGKASPGTYNNLGISHYMLAQYDKALENFRKAAATGPFPRAQNNMALTLCHLKKYDEAFKVFKEADGEIAANNNIGCCLLDDGQRQKAQEHFNKAIALSPRIYKPATNNLARMEAENQQNAPDAKDMGTTQGATVENVSSIPIPTQASAPAPAPSPAAAPAMKAAPAATAVPATPQAPTPTATPAQATPAAPAQASPAAATTAAPAQAATEPKASPASAPASSSAPATAPTVKVAPAPASLTAPVSPSASAPASAPAPTPAATLSGAPAGKTVVAKPQTPELVDGQAGRPAQ